MQAELTLDGAAVGGSRYVLRVGQRFVVGRNPDATIQLLDDDLVSRHHASLELQADGSVVVTDLGSRNGTRLAGERLEPHVPARAAPGDAVEIGRCAIRIDLVGLDPQARRARARTQRLDEPILPRDEFELLGEIGRGATGCVYAARQRLIDRTVAVKVLREHVKDEETRERFLREGRICCRLDSPYIVRVHDVRLSGGRVYLVMELVHGPSAKDSLAAGALPVPEGLKVAEDVAEALSVAHAAGVIHRDIKPANILLGPDGAAKLSDFGIAKEVDAKSLTVTGEGMGTLAYVSPEQATEAKQVDPRTDLYSLGATLYHFISGRPPFIPKNARVILEILDKDPPPLARLRPDCPEDVADFVHRLLAKQPEDRPSPAAFVARELSRLRLRHYPDYVPRGREREGHGLSESTEGTIGG